MKSGKFKLIITTGITQTFICFAFLWGISVSSSLPQLDFSLDGSQSLPGGQGYPLPYVDFNDTQVQTQPLPSLSEHQALPQSDDQQIPPVEELIQKSLQELVGIYLDTTDPAQINDWLDNWNTRNIQIYGEATWNSIPELNKKTELAYYIHLKPVVTSLYSELTTQKEKDEKIAQFADLISGGLLGKDFYSLDEFEKLIALLEGKKLANFLTANDFDPKSTNYNIEIEIEEGNIRAELVEKSETPYLMLYFRKPQDLSNLSEISFDFSFGVQTEQENIPQLVVRIDDGDNNYAEMVINLDDVADVSEKEVKQGFRRITIKDITGSKSVTIKKSDIEGKVNLKDIRSIQILLPGAENAQGNIDIQNLRFDLEEIGLSEPVSLPGRKALLEFIFHYPHKLEVNYIINLLNQEPQLPQKINQAYSALGSFIYRPPVIADWNFGDECLLLFVVKNSGSMSIPQFTRKLAENLTQRAEFLLGLDKLFGSEFDLNDPFSYVLFNNLVDDESILTAKDTSLPDLARVEHGLYQRYQNIWNKIQAFFNNYAPQSDAEEDVVKHLKAELNPNKSAGFSDFLKSTQYDFLIKYLMVVPPENVTQELKAIVDESIDSCGDNLSLEDFNYWLRIKTSQKFIQHIGIEIPLFAEKEEVKNLITQFINDRKRDLGSDGAEFLNNKIGEYLTSLPDELTAEKVSQVVDYCLSQFIGWLGQQPQYQGVPQQEDKYKKKDAFYSQLTAYLNSHLNSQLGILNGKKFDSILNLLLLTDNDKEKLQEAWSRWNIQRLLYKYVEFDKYGRPQINDKYALLYKITQLSESDPQYKETIYQIGAQIMVEDYLERRLNLRHYKDLIMLSYLTQTKKNLDFLSTNLAKRKPYIQEHRNELIDKFIKLASSPSKPYKTDWYWEEIKAGTPMDKAVDLILTMGTFREFLEKTLWDFGVINLNEPREGPFVRYFSEYFPNSGATLEDAFNAILQKLKYGIYSELTTTTREDPTGYSGWRISNPVESTLLPYKSQQLRDFFIYHPEIKALLEALVGPPKYNYNPKMSAQEMVLEDVKKMVQYFLDTQDMDTGIFKDAGGSVDNSIGATGFGITALIIGHQLGMLSDEEFFDRISRLLNFFIDDPDDPNDLAADHWYNMFYHFYTAGTDRHSGNCEISTIDSGALFRGGLESLISYLKVKGIGGNLSQKAKRIADEMDYSAYLAIASTDHPPAKFIPVLNYGYTRERLMTKGIIDTYHEYILANISAIGTEDPAKSIPWQSYYLFARKMGGGSNRIYTSLEGQKYLATWEGNNPFQYSYPWLFMNPRLVKDRGRDLGTEVGNILTLSGARWSDFDFNYYRNSIIDKRDMFWKMILLSRQFRHLGYHTWWFSSMLIPEYYNMDFSLDKHRKNRYEGTVTPTEFAMAMAFMPQRALDAYRYAYSAYQPYLQGDHWFVDSFNPERHFIAPTEIGLGIGAALMGLWNSLVYENPVFKDYHSIWDLMGNSDTTIRGMLRVGFDEDVESIEKFIGEPVTNYDPEKVNAYKKQLSSAGTQEIQNIIDSWLQKSGLSNSYYNAMAEAIKEVMEKKTVTGLEGNEVEIYADTDRNIELFKMLRQVRENQIRANIKEISVEVSPEIESLRADNLLSLNENDFRALLKSDREKGIIRTDGDYQHIISELSPLAEGGNLTAKYRLAITQIYRMENLREAMAYPDERATYAYQHYLEVENEEKPYQSAVDLLTEVVNSTTDAELKIKALTYKFVALRRNLLDYKGIKQTFIELNTAGGKGNEYVHKILTEFFGEEILTILYKQGKITEDELKNYIKDKNLTLYQTQINQYIDFCLENSNPPENMAPDKLAESNYVLNELSLIPYREIAERQNRNINLYNAREAGKLGFYITQMVLEGTPPQKVEEFLETMYRWKPVVRKILGRDLDLWNSQKDVEYLSYVVSLALSRDKSGQRIFSDDDIIRILLEENNKTMEISQLKGMLTEVDLPQYTEAKNFREFISRYLKSGEPQGTEKDTAFADDIQSLVMQKMDIKNSEDARQMVEFIQDMFITSEINFMLVMKSIDALPSLEILSSGNNEWFNPEETSQSTAISDIFKDRILRFKQSALYTDNRDPLSRAWAREIFELIELGKAMGFGLQNQTNPNGPVSVVSKTLTDEQKLALATWYLFLREKGIINPRDDYSVTGKKLERIFGAIPEELKSNVQKLAFLPFYLWDKSEPELETSSTYESLNISTEFNPNLFVEFRIPQEWQDIISPENPTDSLELARLLLRINRVKEIEANFSQLDILSPVLQRFLSEYVLGEPFNPDDHEHQRAYQEWALYRIPEVEECLHRVVDLEKEAEFIYTAGKSVMVPQDGTWEQRPVFRFPTARTSIEILKEYFQAPLVDLHTTHDKEAILQYIWGEEYQPGKELTMKNGIWNAILSYYAHQEDPLKTYLSLGVTKVLVRGLGDFGGLERLYGEEFDLLRTEYDKGYKGIAGYYTTRTLQIAGVGVLDVLYGELGGDFSDVMGKVLSSDDPVKSLSTVLTDRGITDVNTVVTKFGEYLDYIKNYHRMLNQEASDEEITQSAKKWLKDFTDKTFNLAQELQSLPQEELVARLQNVFGWSEDSARNCVELAKDEGTSAYFKIASVITAMEIQKYDIDVLTRVKEAWVKNFGDIYMFNPKNVWLLSAFATDLWRERPQGTAIEDRINEVANKLAAMARGERLLQARAPEVKVDITIPFYSGLVSSIAEGLKQLGYDITEAVDPAYLKYLENNPNFFGQLEQRFAQSQQLQKLIGEYDKNNSTHAGFVASLIYDVWKLMTDKERPLSQEDAITSVLNRIDLISKLFNAGTGDPDSGVFTAEELMKAVRGYEAGRTHTIEDVLKNPDAIGILSFYADLITPITDSEVQEILGNEHFGNVKIALSALQRDRRLPGISISDEELAHIIVFWEKYYGKEFEIPESLNTEKHNFATILFNYEAFGSKAAEWYSPEIIKFLDNVSSLYRMYLWSQLLVEVPETETDNLNNRLRHLVFDMLKVSKQIEPQVAELLGQDYVIRSDDRQAGFLSSLVEGIYNQALQSALGVYNQAYVEALAQWLREKKGLDVVARGSGAGAGLYSRTVIPGHEEERWIGNTPEQAAQIADQQFADWLSSHWAEAGGMTDEQLHAIWQEFYEAALGGMALVYIPPEEILIRITGQNYRRYVSEFEKNNPQLIAQFIQQARQHIGEAIEKETLDTQAQLLTATILKPLVEKSRFMTIDVLDSKQGGILWYYTGRAMKAVNVDSADDLTVENITRQIQASRTYNMIKILNKEIEARRILADNGYNVDPFSTGVWLMGYYANDPNATRDMLLEFASSEAGKSNSGVTRDYTRPDEYKFYKDITPILQAMGIESASFDYARQVLDLIWPDWKNWISEDGYYVDQNKFNAMLEELQLAIRLLGDDTGKQAFAQYLGFENVEQLYDYLNTDLNGVKELVSLAREMKERINAGIAEWEDENYLTRKIRDAREEFERIASSGRGLSEERILSMMKPDLADAYRAYKQIVENTISEVVSELNIMAQLREGKATGSGALEPISRNLLRNYSYIVRQNGATPEEIGRVREIIRNNEFQTADPVLRQAGTVVPPQPTPQPPQPVPQPPAPQPAPQPPAQLTPVEQQLAQLWGLRGDRLETTARYFDEVVRKKIDRELSRIITNKRDRKKFIDNVIAKLIQGIDNWTEDIFSFWMEPAPGVYTGWRTNYPESDGTYSEFIQMFVSRFINRLEDRVKRYGPERINLDEVFEYAKRGGWYINRGTKDARYVTFEKAIQDIKERIAQVQEVVSPPPATESAPAVETPAPETSQTTTEPQQEETSAGVTLPPGIEFAPGEELVSQPEKPTTQTESESGPQTEEVAPPVEEPAPEPQATQTQQSPAQVTQQTPPAQQEPVTAQSTQPEFRFNGWITGPISAEVGQPVEFTLNGNIFELDNPKMIITDANGNTIAEWEVVLNTVYYTFTKPGKYTAQVVGTKNGQTYQTNRFTVNVTQPPQPPSAPQGLEVNIDGRNVSLTWQDTADRYEIALYKDGKLYSHPRTITYNRFNYNWLDPGNYEVRVYAINEQGLRSETYTSKEFTIEEPFYFRGSLSGGGIRKVGETTRFGVWGNVDELDNAELIIKDRSGQEVARIPVNKAGWYEYTWQNPGRYTAQVVGEKGGKEYETNSVIVEVKSNQPVRVASVPQTPQSPELPTVDVYPKMYDLEEWSNPNIKWFKWDKLDSADAYLWQLFKLEEDGTETPVFTNPDTERIVTGNNLRLDISSLQPGTYVFKVKAVKLDEAGNIAKQSPEFGEGRQFTIEASQPEVESAPADTQTAEVASPADNPVADDQPETVVSVSPATAPPLPADDPQVAAEFTAQETPAQQEPPARETQQVITATVPAVTPPPVSAPEITIQNAEYNSNLDAYITTQDVITFQFSEGSKYSVKIYYDSNSNRNFEDSELIVLRNNYPQNTFWFMPTQEGRYKIEVRTYKEDDSLTEPAVLEFIYNKQEAPVVHRSRSTTITGTSIQRRQTPQPSRTSPSLSTSTPSTSITSQRTTSPTRRRTTTSTSPRVTTAPLRHTSSATRSYSHTLGSTTRSSRAVTTTIPARTTRKYTPVSSASFNSGSLLPVLDTAPVLSSLLPDLNFFSTSKPTLTELSLPGYSYPTYVTTVNYWSGIGNRLSGITGNGSWVWDWAIPEITHSFYTKTGFLPYQTFTGSTWISPLYTSGFGDTITNWTDTILNDFSRNYSTYKPLTDTLLDSINWANRLYDLNLGLLL